MEWSKPLREETLESKNQKIDISDITASKQSILEIGIKKIDNIQTCVVAMRKTSPEVRRVSRRDQEERAAQWRAWRSAEGAGMLPSFLA